MVFRIGYDLGGVVIDSLQPGGKGVEIPGALQTITQNVQKFGAENNFIISKVKDSTDTEIWLEQHSFFSRTGFDPANLIFCRYRPEKAAIANNLPGGPLTCFLDDRADVLHHMTGTRIRCLFEPSPKVWVVRTCAMQRVPNWRTFRELCLQQ